MTRNVETTPTGDDESKTNVADLAGKGRPPLKPATSLVEMHAMGSFQDIVQSQDTDASDTSSSTSSSTTSTNMRKRDSSNALRQLDQAESTHLPQDTSEPPQLAAAVNDPFPLASEKIAGTSPPTKTPTMPQSEGKKSRPNSPQRNAKTPKEEDQKRDPVTAETTTTTSNIIRHPDSFTPLLLLPRPDSGNHMDPDEFLLQLVTALYPQVKLQVKSALDLSTSSSYFPTITEEQMARYNTHVVALVRTNNVPALQDYHTTHGPHALDCCNRFGEGLLNMACRRGFTEMVAFLLAAPVSVRVRDDFGRTPLHDACWHPEPQLDICRWIMQQDPSLFLVADKRGYTPFQYARQSDWPIWRKFLVENLEQVRVLGTQPEIVATFAAAAADHSS
jgi:Ankyrin repeats (3 copies)